MSGKKYWSNKCLAVDCCYEPQLYGVHFLCWDIFYVFPWTFIQNTVLPGINKRIDNQLLLGEFLRWLGIWLLLAMINGFVREDFWSE